MAVNSNHFAVVVCVGSYQYPDYDTLSWAKPSAEAFCQWLLGPAGLPDSNVFKVGIDDQSLPTRAVIDGVFNELRNRCSSIPEGSNRLYYYHVGHGLNAVLDESVVAPEVQDLLLTHDSIPRGELLESPYRPMKKSDYERCMARLRNLNEQFLFFENCRVESSAFFGQMPDWCPGRASEATTFRYYSTKLPDVSTKSKEVGIFTQALLEGLYGTAAIDGRVRASNLRDYLRWRVNDIAQSVGTTQSPDVPESNRDAEIVVCEPGLRLVTFRAQGSMLRFVSSDGVQVEVQPGSSPVPVSTGEHQGSLDDRPVRFCVPAWPANDSPVEVPVL